MHICTCMHACRCTGSATRRWGTYAVNACAMHAACMHQRAAYNACMQVRRLYDQEKGTLVYVAYSLRLDKNDDENKSRFRTSMCAVKVTP